MNEILAYLQKKKITHFLDQGIKPYITMKIGGRVKLLAVIDQNDDLRDLGVRILKKPLPHVLLGGGSNVVFSDGFSPIMVLVNRTAEINPVDWHTLRVSSGVTNRDLIGWCIKNGRSGLEFLAGIPGSIGGAAAVNAGAFGRCLSDLLESAEIIDENGVIRRVPRPFFQYRYRESIFKMGKKIILDLFLECRPDEPDRIADRVNSNLKYRNENHPPYRQFTAGCFFKNPLIRNQRLSAGKIIEQAKIKGRAFPHLRISDKHANFIINTGGAGLKELRALEKAIYETVLKRDHVVLEREVIYISPDGTKK